MDKTNSSSSSSNSNKEEYLKHLNKISYKISKQKTNNNPSSSSSFDSLNHHFHHHLQPPPPIQPSIPSSQSQSQSQGQNLQNQPPVYNINKSDFRDVVQKLTGSPAHERFNTPPAPIQQPKPPSSRLHRIRPPPLAHISNRPPSLLNSAAQVQAQVQVQPQPLIPNLHLNIQRQVSPLSPLPPLPSVHAAAESPVSAYMRYLHGSTSSVDSDPKRFSGFSPRWNSNSNQSPSSVGVLPYFPPSPLPFGCVPSPKSSYPLLSPTGGQFHFPLSPK